MIIHRVLDEVFRTWSNVAVIRALLDTTIGFTGNEVARTAGMHPNSALKALTLLEGLNIVNRQVGGRDHIFTLNREHYLVQEALLKIFDIESKFPNELLNTLASILKKRVYSAVIFGSTARREEDINSDLDICCIIDNATDKLNIGTLLDKNSQMLYKRFGVKISAVFFLKDQFVRKRKSKLIKSIVNEGILITGKDPKGLVNG